MIAMDEELEDFENESEDTEEILDTEDREFEQPEDLKIDISDVKFRTLKDFDLSKIEETFKIPSYQRKKVPMHIRRIKEAIIGKYFYDNLISIAAGEPPYEVIDGQQRLEALVLARDEDGLRFYDIMLRTFTEDAREVYRRLNSGKPLTTSDFLKSMDDGTVPFFKIFEKWCTHYPHPNKLQYSVLASSLNYTQNGNLIVTREDIIWKAEHISEKETKLSQSFLSRIEEAVGIGKKPYFSLPVFWNLMRIYAENDAPKEFEDFLDIIKKDSVVLENSKYGKSKVNLDVLYHRMKEDLENVHKKGK